MHLPSTGLLHFSSQVTAVTSYLEARSQAGQWLLRIKDIDPPRIMHGATDLILKTLCMLGFEWDGPVIFQNQRTLYYQAALNILAEQKLSYACNCNRRQLTETGPAYPGTCRNAQLDSSTETYAIRVITHNESIGFTDKLQGYYSQCLQSDIGDFQILKAR